MRVLTLIGLCCLGPIPVEAQSAGRPLRLEDALQIALDRNRQLRVAVLEWERAQQQVRESWGNVYPEITAQTQYTNNVRRPVFFFPDFTAEPGPDGKRPLRPITVGALNAWNTVLTVRQALFQGQVFVGLGVAQVYEELAEEALRGSSLQVVTAVKQAFYGVLLAQEQLRLVQQSIERTEAALREARALQAQGLVSGYDVLRLEVQLANLQPQLIRTQNGVEAAKNALKAQIGLDVEAPIEVSGALAYADARPIPSLEEAFAIAQERRSDLRQARIRARLEAQRVAAERAALYPSLYAFASWQGQAQGEQFRFFGMGDPQQRFVSSLAVGLQLQVPIFSGFRRIARIEQAQLGYRQARTQQEQLEELAKAELRTLIGNLREALARVEAQNRAVEQARKGYEIARARYREGTGSQLEITDAEFLLTQAEVNRLQAIYDALIARAELDRAMGYVPEIEK
ncbi:MAG: TolC family protein [Bacteroidota bacterium]|nr:TolC family protein [Bacteroidota bacterium]